MSRETAGSDEPTAKFPFGQVVSTPNALNNISSDEILFALYRHVSGDWGELDKEDWSRNERALKDGGRLFSSYRSVTGTKFWIITEADRSSTCVLLPEDY